jgi:hypothetical protein
MDKMVVIKEKEQVDTWVNLQGKLNISTTSEEFVLMLPLHHAKSRMCINFVIKRVQTEMEKRRMIYLLMSSKPLPTCQEAVEYLESYRHVQGILNVPQSVIESLWDLSCSHPISLQGELNRQCWTNSSKSYRQLKQCNFLFIVPLHLLMHLKILMDEKCCVYEKCT